MKVPRAICFDAGNTLIDATTAPVEAYHRSAIKLGAESHSSEQLWSVMGPKMRQLFEERAQLAGPSSDAIERQFWTELLEHIIEHFKPCHNLSLAAWLSDLVDWFGSSKAWQPYKDTLPTLETLKNKGTRLALISNWDSSLENILNELQLSKYFEVIHISAQIGWRKPSPKIFEETLKALQLQPEEVCHVGDNIADDIYGAQNCGIEALFLDRWNYGEHVPATRIKTLSEIITIYDYS